MRFNCFYLLCALLFPPSLFSSISINSYGWFHIFAMCTTCHFTSHTLMCLYANFAIEYLLDIQLQCHYSIYKTHNKTSVMECVKRINDCTCTMRLCISLIDWNSYWNCLLKRIFLCRNVKQKMEKTHEECSSGRWTLNNNDLLGPICSRNPEIPIQFCVHIRWMVPFLADDLGSGNSRTIWKIIEHLIRFVTCLYVCSYLQVRMVLCELFLLKCSG